MLVLGGGVVFAASLALFAGAGGFWPLLLALVLFYPASGAFVSLTQAALMDAEPGRREQNMARWALAGSVVGARRHSSSASAFAWAPSSPWPCAVTKRLSR